jgi:pimeloyl-ACP methyl ester carboxylesterase
MTTKHRIPVNENEDVSAVHHEADSDKWIFFCHGFGSNKKGSYIPRSEKLQENGWNAVRFDFRGNGESDGEFIEQNLSTRIEDLGSVIDHFDPESCVVFGSSFGGKVAFHFAAEDKRVEAVIGKAPVTYNDIMSKFRAVIDNKGRFEYIEGKPINERFFEDFDQYSFSDVAESLNVAVAIFHGGADTTVHPKKSFQAAQELSTSVSLHKLKVEKHSFSDEAEEFMLSQMVSWLDSVELE